MDTRAPLSGVGVHTVHEACEAAACGCADGGRAEGVAGGRAGGVFGGRAADCDVWSMANGPFSGGARRGVR